MKTPQHCPGWETFKNLSSFECKCPECGRTVEVFSDEFDKSHSCKGCGKEIDFSKCSISNTAATSGPR